MLRVFLTVVLPLLLPTALYLLWVATFGAEPGRSAVRWTAVPWVWLAGAGGGAQARFVGGSVRDALLGRPIGDIDIATPAPPRRVIELLEKRRIKVVPTGIAHGTVTAIAGTPPRHFEITTLRRDVETYGRRARVAFDADWAADAARPGLP